jgi:hypothetical protein
MRISSHFVKNPGLLSLAIMMIGSGVEATVLPRSFVRIPFVFLLVLLVKSIILFAKWIVRTPSVRVYYHVMKSLLHALLLATLRLVHRNFGFCSALSIVFIKALVTGMTRLMPFSSSLVLPLCFEDPCLYSGFIHNPLNTSSTKTIFPLTLGLYVDDIV